MGAFNKSGLPAGVSILSSVFVEGMYGEYFLGFGVEGCISVIPSTTRFFPCEKMPKASARDPHLQPDMPRSADLLHVKKSLLTVLRITSVGVRVYFFFLTCYCSPVKVAS